MKAAFKLGGRLVAVVAVCANALFAQAQTQAPSITAGDCAGLAEAKARLEAQERRLNDWPDLARYREANAKVAARAEGEQRVVFMGDSITDMWVLPKFGGFFPGRWDQRPCGEYGSDYAGGNGSESSVDGGAGPRQWHSRSAVLGDAGEQLWA